MIYKIYYELDNGYRFENIWSVIISEQELTNEDQVKLFLHTNVHKRSDEFVRRVYEIEQISYKGKNEVILTKVEY